MLQKFLIPLAITIAIFISPACYQGTDNSEGTDPASGPATVDSQGSDPGTTAPALVRREGPNGVILVPGWAGSAHIMFNLDYFWQLDGALEGAGFETDVVPTSCFEIHSLRAKEVAAFIYLKVRSVMKDMVAQGLARNIGEIDPASIRFNFICHSQGGIISRYMIKALLIPDPRKGLPGIDVDALDPSDLEDLKDLQPYIRDCVQVDGPDGESPAPDVPLINASEFVGSIAMLSTPNNGTYIAEWITATAPELIRAIAPGIANFLWAGVVNGQRDSDFTAATSRMTRGYMESTFNPALAEKGRKVPRVKIFTWAAEFKEESVLWWTLPRFIPSFNFMVTGTLWHVIHPVDGSNDGIVPSESALWTPDDTSGDGTWVNMGIIPSEFGVDHWMIINHFADLTHTGINYDATPGFDSPAFFIDVARMLRDEER